MIRVLVCGGRNYADRAHVCCVLDEIHAFHGIQRLIHGAALGADKLAQEWAACRRVSMKVFPADWTAHGRAAGPLRNARMLEVGRPDLVVAFSGGRGTANMIQQALQAGVKVLHQDPIPSQPPEAQP